MAEQERDLTEDEALEEKIVKLAGELLAGKLAALQVHPVEKVVAALSKAQASFTNVAKSKTAKIPTKAGGQYSYQYADLADVMEMVREPLSENGLAISHVTSFHAQDGWNCVTRLYHTSGQYLETVLPIHAGSPQAMGSELTYMRRYGLSCLLGIVTDVDDDGAAAEGGAKQEKRQQAASSGASTRKAATTRKKAVDPAGPRGAKAPAAKKKPADPDSKAGDGTPSKTSLKSFWPMVYATGEALGLDKDGTIAWIRKELKAKGFPGSSKDLSQPQANTVMLWMHELQKDPEGEHVLVQWGEPEQGELGGEEPPPHEDGDAGGEPK